MVLLDKNGLYLYLYLTANNGNGFSYNISPTAFANYYNMNENTAKSTIKRGWENLVKNNFLILEEESQDKGVFLADGPDKVAS
jgi:plasmid replication initiation protein